MHPCLLETKIDQQKQLLSTIADKIECPVCMELPRTGLVPVCPNGHFVCKTCKVESCPTCRSDMGAGKSLLAFTILEKVKHGCKFEDCDGKFLLEDVEKHEENCLLSSHEVQRKGSFGQTCRPFSFWQLSQRSEESRI